MGHFLQSLRVTNLLSFGPEGETVEFGPLNVLIGPNSTGKSNLIDAIDLLRSTARDLSLPIRTGGGMTDWLWQGQGALDTGELCAEVEWQHAGQRVEHQIRLAGIDELPAVRTETIGVRGASAAGLHPHYRYEQGDALLWDWEEPTDAANDAGTTLRPEARKSILAQYQIPGQRGPLDLLRESYERVAIYGNWSIGRRAAHRRRQGTDLDASRLSEDMGNLAMALNGLAHDAAVRRDIVARLRELFMLFSDYTTTAVANTIQLFFNEEHLGRAVPATRLSDGALRFLSLLCILCHPDPPPLVCIEEPEVGLHPDAINLVGQLLVEASERMQIIVTTHSPTLLSALRADDVLVSSLDERGTHLSRLSSDDLAQWLKDYSLGDLWLMGVLGGNRY